MIKRELYLRKLRPYINNKLIKIIVGIRRSGKSTLMSQIRDELLEDGITEKQIIYINFESYEYNEYKTSDALYKYLKERIIREKKTYIFLDEVQEVEAFQKVINSVVVEHDVDMYITGSNSKMLSGELATYFAGRYISIEVYPFSFKELVEYNNVSEYDELFLNYVKYGGLPILQQLDDENSKMLFLQDLYDSVVIKDMIQRHHISNVDVLDRFISYFLDTISSQFSAKNISNYLKSEGRSISNETLYKYIRYCKECYLIYAARRNDLKGKKILSTNEKFFINDQGYRSLKSNNEANIEKILENIIYFELLRRGYSVTVGDINGKEIDFVAEKQGKKEYYQVCYLLATQSMIDREFGSLKLIRDSYPKYVLSLDKFDISQDGIIHKNIIDFLLEEES